MPYGIPTYVNMLSQVLKNTHNKVTKTKQRSILANVKNELNLPHGVRD